MRARQIELLDEAHRLQLSPGQLHSATTGHSITRTLNEPDRCDEAGCNWRDPLAGWHERYVAYKAAQARELQLHEHIAGLCLQYADQLRAAGVTL